MCPCGSCDIAELATEFRGAMAHSRAVALFFIGEFSELAKIISRRGNDESRSALLARVDDLPARLDAVLAAPASAVSH